MILVAGLPEYRVFTLVYNCNFIQNRKVVLRSTRMYHFVSINLRTFTFLLIGAFLSFGLLCVTVFRNPAFTELDYSIMAFLNPARPGLRGAEQVANESCSMVLKILALPPGTNPEQLLQLVIRRLKQSEERHLSAHQQACFVLGMSDSSADYVLINRLKLLDLFMSSYQSQDPRFGTSCAGFTWNTPFKLIKDNRS